MKNTLMVVAAMAFASAGLSAQSPAPIAKRDPGYAVSKTPWGDPDLQGKWPGTDMVGTPMQRDTEARYANVLTEAEYKQVQERFARQAAQDEADFDLEQLDGARRAVTSAAPCHRRRTGWNAASRNIRPRSSSIRRMVACRR